MQSIRALLNRIVDYAGLFPPAKLDMATTVGNYARYLRSREAWMLGRLVIPVHQLTEFEQCAADHLPRSLDEEPWRVSALLSPAGSPELGSELETIVAFNRTHEDEERGLVTIEAVELKAASPGQIDDAIERLPGELVAFFEMAIDADPRELIEALVEGEAGAKVRLGGMAPQPLPSPQDLARFITACAADGVPFKATAGLHHPLATPSPEEADGAFGFVSLFLAACFALTHEMPDDDAATLLQERSLDSFEFDEEAISWRDYRILAQNIEDVRQEFAISFGSCSVEEPVGDLRALKLL